MIVGHLKDWNSSDTMKRKFLFISFGLIIIVAALRSRDVGIDLSHQYADAYLIIKNLDWNDWNSLRYEHGYFIYCKLLSLISGDVQFFIAVTALLTFSSVAYFIYKNSTDVVMSTFLFISMNQMFMYYTGLRQVIAISIVLLSFEAIKKRHWIIYAIITFAALSFHDSAIISLAFPILYFINFKRRSIIISITAIFAALIGHQYIFNYASGLITRYEEGYNSKNRFVSGNISIDSILITLSIVFCFFFAFYMIVWKNKQKEDKKQLLRFKIENGKIVKYRISDNGLSNGFLMYGTLLAMFFQLFVFTVNILTRFRFYYMPFIYISLPLAFSYTTGKYKAITKICIYAGFSMIFLYSCVFLLNQWGVAQYKFFF